MFVRYHVELPLAASRVEEALVASPPGWLSSIAGAAHARGDELLTAVGVGPLGPRLGRRVAIELGDPLRFPSMLSVLLTWEPVRLESLIPRLDATIEVGRSARTAPSWPSAPATARRLAWSAGPSTGCCSTGSPKPP